MTPSHAFGHFDNHTATYRHIEAMPLAAAMGAEISGVDCANLSDAQFEEVRHALFRHKMIFFRNQGHMTHADQLESSRLFGPFAEDAYTQGVTGFAEVQPVVKEADERTGWIFGSGWHTDSPFLREPPAISTLRAVQIPPYGGDTIWANSALAFRSLSETMQRMIDGLRVHMSMREVLAGAWAHGAPGENIIGRLAAIKDQPLSDDLRAKVEGCMHPLIRTHPVTGEKALYCDASYAIGIDGMKPEESAPLLGYLVQHLTQPAFTCRLRWEPGMWVLWDNRLCIHQAFNDYDGYRREMYRTTLAGEIPR